MDNEAPAINNMLNSQDESKIISNTNMYLSQKFTNVLISYDLE